nr:ferrochelatase [Bacillota bacterium]
MMNKPIGLLIMAYGTPRTKEEIEPYYTHIRHGRKPSPEQLADLIHRYEVIGGVSPLAHISEQQAKKLEEEMNRRFPERPFRHYLGYKHVAPFIEDTVEAMHRDGIEEAVALVLAPHYSAFSVKSYHDRAKQRAQQLGGPVIHAIDSWYDQPKFITYWAEQIQQTMARIPQDRRDKTVVIFSAHSLPEKIRQFNDPYPVQMEETARLIAQKAQIDHYRVGWQSESPTGEPWLAPDVLVLTRELFHEEGFTDFIYCPVGFVADHLEVLYDNDVECKEVTDELGARYYRPPMPNDHPLFIEALADAVEAALVNSGLLALEETR